MLIHSLSRLEAIDMATYTLVWVLVTLMFCWRAKSQDCICKQESLQNLYCEADFAIHARIIRKDVRSESHDHYRYNIQILNTLRADRTMWSAENTILWTGGGRKNSCGVADLHVGKTYLITGIIYDRKLSFDTCNWHAPWKSLTSYQKIAVKRVWKKQCRKCKVKLCDDCLSCYGIECNPSVLIPSSPKDTCLINTSEEPAHCFDQYSVCKKQGNKCMFKSTSTLKSCKGVE